MSYGTIGADVIQTSGANLSPVFKDLNDSVVGTLPKSAQIAKAWVNFDGTLSGTITPRASYNVTSVTKNGTGDYTINFTNAMSDANYSATTQAGSLSGTLYWGMGARVSPTVSSFRFNTGSSSAPADCPQVCAVVFGN
jgi:hypothetical protein